MLSKLNKLDLIKIKSFLHSKGNHKKKTAQMEELFANDVSDKGINFQNLKPDITTQYQK